MEHGDFPVDRPVNHHRFPQVPFISASCGSGQAMPSFRMGVVQVMKVWLRTGEGEQNSSPAYGKYTVVPQWAVKPLSWCLHNSKNYGLVW